MVMNKLSALLFCFFVTTSCVDDLDFSQIEDYSISPEYTVSLTYFTILPPQFFNLAGVQLPEISDITDFRGFENSYARDKLLKLDFYVEIKNEFDRDLTIQISFLDDSMNVAHRFEDLKVNANNLNYKFEETIEVSTNPNIKTTTKVRVVIIDQSASPLDASVKTEFEFKSSVKIYVNV
jgi:hypothetical protein